MGAILKSAKVLQFFHELQCGYDMISNQKHFPDLHHGEGWGDAPR